jgi:hypothetical protein
VTENLTFKFEFGFRFSFAFTLVVAICIVLIAPSSSGTDIDLCVTLDATLVKDKHTFSDSMRILFQDIRIPANYYMSPDVCVPATADTSHFVVEPKLVGHLDDHPSLKFARRTTSCGHLKFGADNLVAPIRRDSHVTKPTYKIRRRHGPECCTTATRSRFVDVVTAARQQFAVAGRFRRGRF